MEVITDDMTGYRLRRRAIVFWIISGVLDASSLSEVYCFIEIHGSCTEWMQIRQQQRCWTEIAESTSPYVKIEGIELTFTGYYKVNGNGTVCSLLLYGINRESLCTHGYTCEG